MISVNYFLSEPNGRYVVRDFASNKINQGFLGTSIGDFTRSKGRRSGELQVAERVIKGRL